MRMLSKYRIEFNTYPLWLRILLPSSGLIFVIALISQMTLFPDNPIYLKNGSYVGKYGAAHTREEYDLFIALNRTIFASGLAFFGGLFSSVIFGSARTTRQDAAATTADRQGHHDS